ncbi:MAG: signal peptidase II [Oscillospiraceae bacterium]|nr:signal peptidase II [Oscillospiraceae bacterium]
MLALSFILAGLLVLLDQLLKLYISTNFELCTSVIHRYWTFSIGSFDVFSITHIRNDGAGWSILGGQTVFLLAFTSIVLIAIVIYMFVKRKSIGTLEYLTLSLIIGGGIGNMIDRVRMLIDSEFTGVVDYIALDFIDFPVFNFADMCVVVGGIGLCLIYFWQEAKDSKAKKLAKAAEAVEESETEEEPQGEDK